MPAIGDTYQLSDIICCRGRVARLCGGHRQAIVALCHPDRSGSWAGHLLGERKAICGGPRRMGDALGLVFLHPRDQIGVGAKHKSPAGILARREGNIAAPP